jgi:hypothetical protein
MTTTALRLEPRRRLGEAAPKRPVCVSGPGRQTRCEAAADGNGPEARARQALVEPHGGTIRVERATGRGSPFVFTLPRRTIDAA